MERTILFLCQANSARSQMAEVLARSMAPPGVKVLSAGSSPTGVNPLAVRVLEEVGLDATGQTSKDVKEIPSAEVDVVVTLCEEEICPTFPGEVETLQWPLPDPAAVMGTEEERLVTFRAVRDELKKRLAGLLGVPG